MKATLHAGYLLIALMLSSTLFAVLEVFGVKPNLFLIYIVFAGFFIPQKEAIWLGFIYGLLNDIIIGENMGLNGIVFMFICFFTVLFCENMIRRSNAILSFICIIIWTIFAEGVNSLFSPVRGVFYKISVIGIEALYNGFLMLMFYVPLNKLFRKLYDEKR